MNYDDTLTEAEFATFTPNTEVLRYLELTRQRLGLARADMRVLDWGSVTGEIESAQEGGRAERRLVAIGAVSWASVGPGSPARCRSARPKCASRIAAGLGGELDGRGGAVQGVASRLGIRFPRAVSIAGVPRHVEVCAGSLRHGAGGVVRRCQGLMQ